MDEYEMKHAQPVDGREKLHSLPSDDPPFAFQLSGTKRAKTLLKRAVHSIHQLGIAPSSLTEMACIHKYMMMTLSRLVK